MSRSTSHCRTCGRTLNGALCCPDCGTPTEHAYERRGPAPAAADEPVRAPEQPGPLPPVAPDDAAFAPSPEPDPSDEAPGPGRRRGRNAALALVVVAALGAGATTLALRGTEPPSDAAPPHSSAESPQPEPVTPGKKLPTGSPTPRTGGSNPEPAPGPATHRATPPPPAPTPAPETNTPGSEPSTARPRFSLPEGFPTPSGCAYTRWC